MNPEERPPALLQTDKRCNDILLTPAALMRTCSMQDLQLLRGALTSQWPEDAFAHASRSDAIGS